MLNTIKKIFKWIFSYDNSSINNFGRIMFFLSWLPITLFCSSNFLAAFYTGFYADDPRFAINYQIFLIVFVSLSYNLFFPRLFTLLAFFITYPFNLAIVKRAGILPGFLNIKILFPEKFLAPKYEKKSKRWIDQKTGQNLSDTHEKINVFLVFTFAIHCLVCGLIAVTNWESGGWWCLGYYLFCTIILFLKYPLFKLFDWKFLNPKQSKK